MPGRRKSRDITGEEILDNTVPMDDIPLEVNAEENTNGHGPLSDIPGQTDVLVSMGQGSPNLAMVLLTGSDEPKEFLVRARFSAKEIQDMQEMIAIENEVNYGATDIMGIIGWKANATAGQNGEARREAVKIGTAISRMAMMRRSMGGMFNRFKGANGDGGY